MDEHIGPNDEDADSTSAVVTNFLESEAEGSRQPPAKRVAPKGVGIVHSALLQIAGIAQ